MARPKSEDKRSAVLSAAIRVIALKGLSAPTATIAKEAGVSNGSLFNYFETKADLYNELYTKLKAEMARSSLDNFPEDAEARDKLFHVWSRWLDWATSSPDKRRTLAQLELCEEISLSSGQLVHDMHAALADVLDHSRVYGALRDAPLAFVLALANALAEATIDHMILDSDNAKTISRMGFEALWRMMA